MMPFLKKLLDIANPPIWLRVLFPSAGLLLILGIENMADRWRVSLALLGPICIVSGILFYFVHYYFFHPAIRLVTDRVFGLPTFNLLRTIAEERNIKLASYARFDIQNIISNFFSANPSLRKPPLVAKSSVFHGLYMLSIIYSVYEIYRCISHPDALSFSFLALCIAGIFIIMACDKYFGESEECALIKENKNEFIKHLRRYAAK